MKLSEGKKAKPFIKIEESFATTYEAGVYRQAEIYQQDKAIYLKKGSGFLKIYDDGHTSNGKVICNRINIKGKEWAAGRMGVLEVVK